MTIYGVLIWAFNKYSNIHLIFIYFTVQNLNKSITAQVKIREITKHKIINFKDSNLTLQVFF